MILGFPLFRPSARSARLTSSRSDPEHTGARGKETTLQATNVNDPAYFHKVVDCQWACPAHTPVPEYIRLIGQGRYDDAYMVNWVSNVFPGVLGRTCDRPCEPACRRGRVEENNPSAGPPQAGSAPLGAGAKHLGGNCPRSRNRSLSAA